MKQLRLFAAVCAALLAVAAPAAGLEKPKYIFLFIGDGMGAPQGQPRCGILRKTAAVRRIRNRRLTATRSLNSYITDSAAAGTALASGSKTNSGMVGRAPDGTPLPSYVIAAREKGRKVGVVTSVSLDHATPAALLRERAVPLELLRHRRADGPERNRLPRRRRTAPVRREKEGPAGRLPPGRRERLYRRPHRRCVRRAEARGRQDHRHIARTEPDGQPAVCDRPEGRSSDPSPP